MKQDAFRTVLFWAFLLIFLATAALVLLSLVGRVQIDESYKKWMFSILIVEVVGCIIAFWKQLNVSFSDPPDIAGEWEYECIREDASYKHGGNCAITLQKSSFGWEFSIHGQRTWMAQKKDENWEKKVLEAPYSWESSWGTFLSDNELRYGYSIQVGEVVIQGYGFLTIPNIKDKKPSSIEGNFYQLPPGNRFYGFEKYQRINTSPSQITTHSS